MSPPFIRSIEKTKVLNNLRNQFVYHFYPQSIFILEKCLQKWWNAKLFSNQFYEKILSIRERNMKLLLETVTYSTVTCITMEIVMCIMHCRKYHLYDCNRDSHLHNYNKNCHPHICCRNCHLHMCCRNF